MKTYDNVIGRDRETEGLVFALLGILLFSVSTPATRAAAPWLGGPFVGVTRGVVGGVLAWAWLRRAGVGLPPKEARVGVGLVALGSVVGFPVFSALAMQRVPASHGLVTSALLPAATALVAVLRVGERTSPRFWLGLGGGVALVLRHALREGGGALGWADGLLFLGVALCALGYAEAGRLATRFGGTQVLAWSLACSLPVLAPALLVITVTAPPAGPPSAWLGLAYTSVFSTWVGFQFWYRGMAAGGITRASQLQVLQPLLGLGWAALFLGEPLSWDLVATALGVVGCVALGRRSAPAARRCR